MWERALAPTGRWGGGGALAGLLPRRHQRFVQKLTVKVGGKETKTAKVCREGVGKKRKKQLPEPLHVSELLYRTGRDLRWGEKQS